MTKEEILQEVKNNVGASDYSHDPNLRSKINDTISYIKLKTGIDEKEQLEQYAFIIIRGASDLFNYNDYQQMFLDLIVTIGVYGSGNNA